MLTFNLGVVDPLYGVLDPLCPLLASSERFVLSLLFSLVNLFDLIFFVDVCLLCCYFMYYLIDFLFLFLYYCSEGCHAFTSFILCWLWFYCFQLHCISSSLFFQVCFSLSCAGFGFC